MSEKVIVRDSTFSENQLTRTDSDGGAIIGQYLEISNCTFIKNTATKYGAIYPFTENFRITDNVFYKNSPPNFIINGGKIQLVNKDNYIYIGKFSVNVDGEEIVTGSGESGLKYKNYIIPDDSNYVEIIINDTEQKTMNNRYILKNNTVDVNNYEELVEAIQNLKDEKYGTYNINLLPGDYNATDNIEWDDSATRNIIINGNGITFDGQNIHQFINITSEHNNLTLTNITITNYKSTDHGGAICNKGTLTITDTTLENNTATSLGGVIRNDGTLNIKDTTFKNNNATSGGAIYNIGTLTITDTTLENNNATSGGAIYNIGRLSITDTTLENNNATRGGAIFNGKMEYFNISNSNFTKNYANNRGGAIFSNGYANLTGNIFTDNTAGNMETIDLYEYGNGLFKDNYYKSADIQLDTIELSVKDNKESFNYGEDIELYFTLGLDYYYYYYNDISDRKIDKTIIINNEENITTTRDNHILSNLKPGKYSVNYTTCHQQSNTVTFKIIGTSEITTSQKTYEYYDGVKNTVTLDITDFRGEKGTVEISVKEGEKYTKLLIYPNVKTGYNFTTETIADALSNLYEDLEDSYVINVTYTGDYANPSSTLFT